MNDELNEDVNEADDQSPEQAAAEDMLNAMQDELDALQVELGEAQGREAELRDSLADVEQGQGEAAPAAPAGALRAREPCRPAPGGSPGSPRPTGRVPRRSTRWLRPDAFPRRRS